MRLQVTLAACALAAACGGQSGSVSTVADPTVSPSPSASPPPSESPSPSPLPTNSPMPPKASGPHFDTPEAAMRYLATAWNAMDMTSLKHVTDPNARQLLIDMYREAA